MSRFFFATHTTFREVPNAFTIVRIPESKRYKRNHKGSQKKIPYMVLNTLEYFIMIVSRSRTVSYTHLTLPTKRIV